MEFVARAGSPPWGATAPRGVWRAGSTARATGARSRAPSLGTV